MEYIICLFWRFGIFFLVKILWKIFVLEIWIINFDKNFVENIRFGNLIYYF